MIKQDKELLDILYLWWLNKNTLSKNLPYFSQKNNKKKDKLNKSVIKEINNHFKKYGRRNTTTN